MPETAASVQELIFNPRTADYSCFDEETRRLLRATIDYFEGIGKQELLRRDRDAVIGLDERRQGARRGDGARRPAGRP